MVQIPCLPLGMVNAYLVLGERPVLVDVGPPGREKLIERALARHGIRLVDVALVVITHGHVDHFGGLPRLRASGLRCPIAIHAEASPFLARGFGPPLRATSLAGRIFSRLPPPNAKVAPVTAAVTFEKDLDLRPYGLPGECISTPGHSRGDVSVVVDGGDVISGDLVWGGMLIGGIARRTTPLRPAFQEDDVSAIDSIAALLARDPRRFFVGHGGPLDAPLVRKFVERERLRYLRRALPAHE